MSTLYETDFYGWTQETAESVRQGRFAEIDLTALAGEIDDLGEALQGRLQRRFELYLTHRLKWEYQPAKRTRSWTLTMKEQHRRAVKLAEKNPSLRPHLHELFSDAYISARVDALNETGLEESEIPETSAFHFEECFPELA